MPLPDYLRQIQAAFLTAPQNSPLPPPRFSAPSSATATQSRLLALPEPADSQEPKAQQEQVTQEECSAMAQAPAR